MKNSGIAILIVLLAFNLSSCSSETFVGQTKSTPSDKSDAARKVVSKDETEAAGAKPGSGKDGGRTSSAGKSKSSGGKGIAADTPAAAGGDGGGLGPDSAAQDFAPDLPTDDAMASATDSSANDAEGTVPRPIPVRDDGDYAAILATATDKNFEVEDDDGSAGGGSNGLDIDLEDGESVVNVIPYSFGGTWRTIGANFLANANQYTGSGSCPEGYKAQLVHEFTDRGNEYYCRNGACGMSLHACFRKPLNDRIGGIYRTFANGSCSNSNYYTGDCSCPAGYNAHMFSEFTDFGSRFFCAGNSRTCGEAVMACIADKPGNSGGFFRVKKAGAGCGNPNPATGDCSCPSGFRSTLIDEFSDFKHKYYCYAGLDDECGNEVFACVK